ncbi:hypothetical protein S83_047546 [Arachis hypogaea]
MRELRQNRDGRLGFNGALAGAVVGGEASKGERRSDARRREAGRRRRCKQALDDSARVAQKGGSQRGFRFEQGVVTGWDAEKGCGGEGWNRGGGCRRNVNRKRGRGREEEVKKWGEGRRVGLSDGW